MARNGYRIIINKGKTKEKLLLFLSLPEMIICVIVFGITFKLFGFIMGELYGLIVSIGCTAVCGALFIELPNHMNILQHIQLAYHYYLKEPKEYFYYKKSDEKREVEKNEPIKKIETRYKAEGQKKQKRKKK